MKKDKKFSPPKKRKKFALTNGFNIYIVVLAGALVFTQALRSPLSSLMLVFVMILPVIGFLYMLTALAALKVFVKDSSIETVKNVPVDYNIKIINDAILPYPFIEADLIMPNEDIVRCVEKRVGLSLAPFGFYKIAEKPVFKYRGSYQIGVRKLYISDMFRMFRITLKIDVYTSVFVAPRRFTLEAKAGTSASDVNTDSTKNIIGVDRSELNEIRTYLTGDHMKNIHWKLSSKTQELMVKEFAMNSGKTIYIFVDMAANYDINDKTYSDDINEFVADGVIETALAAALRELQEGNGCTIIWYDERIESGAQICKLQTANDLDRVFKMFATAELCRADKKVTRLAALATETQAVTMIFVTGMIDQQVISDLAGIAGLQVNVELYHFSAADKIADDKKLDDFVEHEKVCRDQLVLNGVNVFNMKF